MHFSIALSGLIFLQEPDISSNRKSTFDIASWIAARSAAGSKPFLGPKISKVIDINSIFSPISFKGFDK